MHIEELLKLSVEKKASDLHISPEVPPLMRLEGELLPIPDMPKLTPEQAKKLLYDILTKDQQTEFEGELELDFGFVIPGVANFRVNIFHEMNGIAAVFRIISLTIPTLDELEMPPLFKNLLELPNGLILVTGPTGSGKSTTLAAMVDYINTHQDAHIITIEDPIEYIHKSKKSLISQREVHKDTHSFNTALRSALREDPDVILVGELRDLETIRLALTAAETGHLVLATLHTSSAPRTVSRVVDVFPSGEKNIIRNILSESLQAVICQTLLKREQGGMIAALEIMVGTPAIRNLIREDKVPQMISALQTGSQWGMCTLDQYVQKLAAKQIISSETAQHAAIERDFFYNNVHTTPAT